MQTPGLKDRIGGVGNQFAMTEVPAAALTHALCWLQHVAWTRPTEQLLAPYTRPSRRVTQS